MACPCLQILIKLSKGFEKQIIKSLKINIGSTSLHLEGAILSHSITFHYIGILLHNKLLTIQLKAWQFAFSRYSGLVDKIEKMTIISFEVSNVTHWNRSIQKLWYTYTTSSFQEPYDTRTLVFVYMNTFVHNMIWSSGYFVFCIFLLSEMRA